MDWYELKTQNDIDALLDTFGFFHDGCLKELKYLSGVYVEHNLSIHPINSERKLSVIFQRKIYNPSVIEVVFEGLEKLNLEPYDERYDGIIFGAYMGINGNKIYWADNTKFSFDKGNNCTWISADKAKWRVADEYMGAEEVYISK